VPKNSVVVVSREKGGYIAMLQASLTADPVPGPRLQEVWHFGNSDRQYTQQLLYLLHHLLCGTCCITYCVVS
jgi:hypothetical protein